MKQYMKYVTALLFVLSLVILLFLPVITVASMDISMIDVLRLGGQAGSGSGVFAELLQSYLKPYFFGILLVILLILAAAVLSAVLPWRYAYLEALIGAIAANLAVIICVASLYSKVSELRSGLGFFGMGDVVEIHILPVVCWAICYVAILGISIWGIVMTAKRPRTYVNRQILPENFHQRKNPWEDRRELTEQVKRGTVKEKEIYTGETGYDFHGALLGMQDIYRDKVYPLEEKVPVFLAQEEAGIYVSERKEPEALVEIYYISEYGEYCVTPEKKGVCFLESGQPLGGGRHYYLKRGTRICAGEKRMIFELA